MIERDTDMLVAGIDIRGATAKTVILGDGKILGYAIRPVGYDVIVAKRNGTSLFKSNGRYENAKECWAS